MVRLLGPRGGGGPVVRVVRVQWPEGGRGVGEPVPVVVVGPEREEEVKVKVPVGRGRSLDRGSFKMLDLAAVYFLESESNHATRKSGVKERFLLSPPLSPSFLPPAFLLLLLK